MDTYAGCLIDIGSGDVKDAGFIQMMPSQHILIAHGGRTSSWLPNVNHIVMVVWIGIN